MLEGSMLFVAGVVIVYFSDWIFCTAVFPLVKWGLRLDGHSDEEVDAILQNEYFLNGLYESTDWVRTAIVFLGALCIAYGIKYMGV